MRKDKIRTDTKYKFFVGEKTIIKYFSSRLDAIAYFIYLKKQGFPIVSCPRLEIKEING